MTTPDEPVKGRAHVSYGGYQFKHWLEYDDDAATETDKLMAMRLRDRVRVYGTCGSIAEDLVRLVREVVGHIEEHQRACPCDTSELTRATRTLAVLRSIVRDA
jgi:hypothetical protein